jgi:hypothetical protein
MYPAGQSPEFSQTAEQRLSGWQIRLLQSVSAAQGSPAFPSPAPAVLHSILLGEANILAQACVPGAQSLSLEQVMRGPPGT